MNSRNKKEKGKSIAGMGKRTDFLRLLFGQGTEGNGTLRASCVLDTPSHTILHESKQGVVTPAYFTSAIICLALTENYSRRKVNKYWPLPDCSHGAF